jgi:hypothetical protein
VVTAKSRVEAARNSRINAELQHQSEVRQVRCRSVDQLLRPRSAERPPLRVDVSCAP